MAYLGRQPNTGVRSRYIYTATASQTTFTGSDDDGKTLKYEDAAYVDVFLNGVLLKPVTDYTATSKTSVVLTSGASASDIVEIVAYDIANIADAVSAANGGVFGGNILAPTLTVQNLQGPSTGANANKILIPSGQTLDASSGSLNASGGLITPAGHVIQVVQSLGTSQVTTTSTSEVNSGISASITPSSTSSKVLVSFFCRLYISTSNVEPYMKIYRNASTYIQGGAAVFNGANGDRIAQWYHISVLDEPATTSSVSYNLYFRVTGAATVHINPQNAADGKYGFILQEIAG